MSQDAPSTDRSIRHASREDIETIVSFQLAMARETEQLELDPAVCRRGVEAVFDDPSHGCYWVVEEAGTVVASLMTTWEWSDWRAGTVWWIQSVYVRPESRRRGVYASLYEHLKAAAAAEKDVSGIRLYVDKTNLAAQQTYAALGMNGEHYLVFEWMKE